MMIAGEVTVPASTEAKRRTPARSVMPGTTTPWLFFAECRFKTFQTVARTALPRHAHARSGHGLRTVARVHA